MRIVHGNFNKRRIERRKTMVHCKNCGQELTEGQSFCNQCGTDNRKEIENSRTGERKKSEKTLKKGTKVMLIAIVVVLLSLLGTHFYFSQQYKPEKTVETFEKAVSTKDQKQLAKIVNEGQNKVSVTEKEMESYITYLTKENNFSSLMKDLKEQSIIIGNDGTPKPVTDQYGNKALLLKESTKKKWGIYKQYVIEVIPFQLKVSANFPNTSVSMNGKKVKTIKKEDNYVSLGYIIPGNVHLEAICEGEYSTFELKDTIDFSIAENNVIQHELEFEGTYITIESNYEDGKIFVNGKDAKVNVADASEFGPLATDGSVKIFAERTFPTGVKKSNTVTVDGDSYMYLEFKEAETEAVDDPKEELNSLMNGYISSNMDAINYGDFSYVSNYLDPSGPAYKQTRNYNQQLNDRGIGEDSLKVEVKDYEIVDENTFKVFTYEEYKIYYSEDEVEKFKAFNAQYLVKVTEDGNMKVYQLIDTKEIK